MAMGYYRNTDEFFLFKFFDAVEVTIRDLFVWDTASFSFIQSIAFIRLEQILPSEEHLYYLQQFFLSFILGGSKVPDSAISIVAQSWFPGMGGGILPFYGFFYFGWPGCALCSVIVAFWIRMINSISESISSFKMLVTYSVAFAVFRWYIYSPSPFTSGLLIATVVCFLTVVLTENLRDGKISQGKKYPQAVGNILDGAIQPVMLSAVARVRTNVKQVRRLVRRALKTSTFLIVPAMTLFAVAAEPIVGILLGEKWLPCVPFLQMYCFIYALLPIHSTNLQALNGMGRSDLFLKLELIKKAYGICFILFAAFGLHDVYLMVAMYMITGVISTFVNAYPNKRVIGYSYSEQLRDIAPAFVISAIAGGLALFCGSFVASPGLQIFVEVAVMAITYFGIAGIFKLEAFEYLINTARDFLGAKRR